MFQGESEFAFFTQRCKGAMNAKIFLNTPALYFPVNYKWKPGIQNPKFQDVILYFIQ